MTKEISLLIILNLLFIPFAISQSEDEEITLGKIEEIGWLIDGASITKKGLKDITKELKEISEEHKKNIRLRAVANALSGKTLTEFWYHKEATPFYKRSLKLRKKEGDYLPQRWALHSLMENGMYRDDLRFTFKYAKKWIQLTSQDPKQLESIYGYDYEGEKYFEIELGKLIRRIHPTYFSSWKGNKIQNWKSRSKYSHALLKYYLKEFPENKDFILKDTKEFSEYAIRRILRQGDGKAAQEWAEGLLKSLKKHISSTEHTDFYRFFASLFKKDENKWSAPRTTDFEYIGIGLMQGYIKKCKKIKRHDQVIFAHRHLATRYKALEDYRQTVQHLAEAIKYAHKYNLKEEIVKSYGGLHQMIQELKEINNQTGIKDAKKWKENYSLKGLLKENIVEFDNILN